MQLKQLHYHFVCLQAHSAAAKLESVAATAIKECETSRKSHEDELEKVKQHYELAVQLKEKELNLVKESESSLEGTIVKLKEEIARQVDAHAEEQRRTADTLASLKQEVCVTNS